LEDLSAAERILKWMYKNCNGRVWMRLIWLRRGTTGRLVKMVMILQTAQNEGNSLPIFGNTSFSKRPLFYGVILVGR